MPDASRKRPSKQREPLHRIPWYPHDWISSPLRLQLIAEGDHLARLGYFEILNALYEAGGRLRRDEAAGAMMLPSDESERVVERLIASKRITLKNGCLMNERVDRVLAQEEAFRKSQKEKAIKRWEKGSRSKAEAMPRHSAGNASPSPPPPPSPSPSPPPSPQREETSSLLSSPEGKRGSSKRERVTISAGAERIAARLTKITNGVLGRKLGKNRALSEAVEKALGVGFTEDEIVSALWAGLCGPDGWWRAEEGGRASLTLLMRYAGGTNPQTGQPAKQFLPENASRFGEVFPARIAEAVTKLRAAHLDVEVSWLQERSVRGSE